METCRVGCVVMAAGNGTRFGANKLLAEYRGQALIRRALAAVPAELTSRTAVVTQYEEIEDLAREFGFRCLRNHRPELGISRTVALGTAALKDECDGILYLTGDQPLLDRETVARMVDAFCKRPDRILVPAADGRRGSPCVFPKDLFPALLALRGDVGGRQVIRANPDRVLAVPVSPQVLYDVDTLRALEALGPG